MPVLAITIPKITATPVAGERQYIHTAMDGNVWYSLSDNRTRSSGRRAAAFLADPPCGVDRQWYLAGTVENAPLISSLAEHSDISAFVCTPLACSTAVKCAVDPDYALCLLSQWTGTVPSQGGWRPLTALDALTYRMTAASDTTLAQRRQLLGLLVSHPLFKSLQFIRGSSELACARVIGLLRDPRWFVDPTKPDSSSRLMAFFGLCRRGWSASPKYCWRRRQIREAWQGIGAPPNAASLQYDPGCFLWRFFSPPPPPPTTTI